MSRKAKILRKTKETNIAAEVNLDGKGKYQIKTKIGFLDHMLEQLSKHSLIDIKLVAKGDTHIDLHHTTEDSGISNRPYLIWKVDLKVEKLGEMDTELFKEWFQAFSQSAGITLHVENIYGENSHHKIESCFKALARSLRGALELDKRAKNILPSTKGKI